MSGNKEALTLLKEVVGAKAYKLILEHLRGFQFYIPTKPLTKELIALDIKELQRLNAPKQSILKSLADKYDLAPSTIAKHYKRLKA